jgi:hypothetical protein
MAMSVSERVGKRRAALRAAGLRPIQIWVPDTSAPGFAEECARQCRLIRDSGEDAAIQDFFEAAADTEGWE